VFVVWKNTLLNLNKTWYQVGSRSSIFVEVDYAIDGWIDASWDGWTDGRRKWASQSVLLLFLGKQQNIHYFSKERRAYTSFSAKWGQNSWSHCLLRHLLLFRLSVTLPKYGNFLSVRYDWDCGTDKHYRSCRTHWLQFAITSLQGSTGSNLHL